jgi:hypothetical protein
MMAYKVPICRFHVRVECCETVRPHCHGLLAVVPELVLSHHMLLKLVMCAYQFLHLSRDHGPVSHFHPWPASCWSACSLWGHAAL